MLKLVLIFSGKEIDLERPVQPGQTISLTDYSAPNSYIVVRCKPDGERGVVWKVGGDALVVENPQERVLALEASVPGHAVLVLPERPVEVPFKNRLGEQIFLRISVVNSTSKIVA